MKSFAKFVPSFLRTFTTVGETPASLVSGEIAINETDSLLFFRNLGVVKAFSLTSTDYTKNGAGAATIRVITQADYTALASKDANTVYFITE